MSLEALIQANTEALKENTEQVKALRAEMKSGGKVSSAAAAAKEAPAKAVKAADPAISFEAVKKAAAAVKAKHGAPLAKRIIQTIGGAEELAKVDPKSFAKLYSAFEEALDMKPKTEEEEEEDEL